MSLPIVILIAMMVAIATLAGYRKIVARDEDDYLHMSDPDGRIVQGQQRVDRSLTKIDRIARVLTILTVVYGLVLFGSAIYQAFVHPVAQ